MAYLMLVRGMSAWRKGVTTHGANSVATDSFQSHPLKRRRKDFGGVAR